MKYFYLLLLSLSPAFVFSQTNFKPGYVITNKNDTLKGYIDYREWDQAPKTVKFNKNARLTDSQDFSATDIKQFTVDGQQTYISFSGRLSTDKNLAPGLTTGIDTTTTQQTVFMKLLAGGKNANLYAHRDEIKTRFFIQETDNIPAELSYHAYNNADGSEVVQSNGFRHQLAAIAMKYTANNNDLINKIQYANYSDAPLIRIVNTINNTKPGGNINNKGKIRFFAGAGVNVIDTKFTGNFDLANAAGKTDIKPVFSVGVDFFRNPDIQRFIFRGEFSYWFTSRNFEATGSSNSYSSAKTTYAYGQKTLSFAPQILYAFYTTEALKLYLGAGVGINYSNYNNNPIVVDYGTSNANISTPDFKKTWFNFPLQVSGVVSKKIELNVKYILPQNFSGYSSYGLQSSILSAGVHYLF